MINVKFPDHDFKVKKVKSKELIFDECRKQWVPLTPEEWVRQNFLQYLVQVQKYPTALIAVEREIKLNDTRKRFDIVVFKNDKPWMIVECKEMQVQLSEAVITQILNYNIVLQVQYLVITNGTSTFCLHLQQQNHEWMESLPVYNN